MTRDRWNELLDNNVVKLLEQVNMYTACPESWGYLRLLALQFIKEADEATEVFEMENKIK